MKSNLPMSRGGRLLVIFGIVLIVVAALLFVAGLMARQSIESAENQVREHAAQLAHELTLLQDRLRDVEIERSVLAAPESNASISQALMQTLRRRGFDGILTAQVFDPDLETLSLGEYPDPDFTTLEVLLEARRTGQAMPEARVHTGQPSHLVLAKRVGSMDQPAEGIVLIRLPIQTLVDRVNWSSELDYLALSQGLGERRTEFWSRGSQPERAPARIPVQGTRFWLEWHRSTTAPLVGLREASIIALGGVILLLFGMSGQFPGLRASVPARRRGPQRVRPGTLAAAETPNASPAPDAERAPSAAAAVEAQQSKAPPDPPASPEAQPEVPASPYALAETADQTEPSLSLFPDSDEPDAEPPETAADATEEPGERTEIKLETAAEVPPGRTSEPSPVDPNLFTDAGILGRHAAGLDARSATLIGQAIAAAAAERGVTQVAVGRDGRLHGPVLLAALTEGLRSAGMNVVDFGALPSPLLDFAAHDLTQQSSVMVGAAHLPGEWNGFRIRLKGEPLCGQAIHDLLERIRAGIPADGNGQLEEASVIDRYVETQKARIRLDRPLKVVVDCANGIAGLVLPQLLTAIGAEVVPLYADVDGSFPNHAPDPSRLENLEDLRLCVRNFRADLGLAIGGDGDRVVMVGPDGSVLWPDRLLMLLARDFLAREAGAVIVHDALCSPRVEPYVRSHGGTVRVSELGAAALWRSLQAQGGGLGGTFNGHFILPGNASGSADGLLAACRLLEILAADARDVAEQLQELPSSFSLPAAFVATRPTPPEQVMNQLLESADVSDAEVDSEHGFTINYGHAWTRICRSADGNGLMVRFEGEDEAAARSLTVLVRQLLLAVDERLQIPF